MKNTKKLIKTLALTIALTLGTSAIPSQKAEAGIIVIAAPLGLIGPLIGLSMVATGFFWGIQTDEINYYAAGLFLLDEKTNQNDLTQILAARYPELDSFIIEELASLAVKKANVTNFNQEGLKEISLEEAELAPVIELIAQTNESLAQQVLKDLTK